MTKKFDMTFEEVMNALKGNSTLMAQGDKYQNGCVFYEDPVFNFLTAVIFVKDENGNIKKQRECQFLMSVETFYQKYRLIKNIEDIF